MSQPNPANILPLMSPSGPMVPPDERESIPLTEASDRLLEQGIAAARAGQTQDGLRLIDQALAINIENVEALLWRGGLCDPAESISYLSRAVELDPSNKRAQQGLEWARERLGLAALPSFVAAPPPPAPKPQRPVSSDVKPSNVGSFHMPDLAGKASDLLMYLVERPTMALIIAVLFVGMLGTAAVARGGMHMSHVAIAPTPQPAGVNATNPLVVAGSAITVSARSPMTATLPMAATRPASGTLQTVAASRPMTMDDAWAAGDWPQVITLLEEKLKAKPSDTTLTGKLFTAYYNNAVQMVRSDRLS